MEIQIKKIPPDQTELLQIRCHEVTDEIKEIAAFVKSRQGELSAQGDEGMVKIPLVDIFYAESIDNKLFLYTAGQSYEVRLKLYELEERLTGRTFLRVQKGMILNLMKIQSIKPALSGRYMALLKNGEEVVISRKYVADLKSALKGGAE